MKKKLSLFCAFVLLVAMMVPAAQAQSTYQETETVYTEYGDFEIETTTIVYNTVSRSSSRSADKEQVIKYGGKVIAEVTLSATFGYDGKTAWVISASGSHTTYDGWSYSGEKITKSGGSAALTAKLSKWSEGTANVNISLKCSPSGQIS